MKDSESGAQAALSLRGPVAYIALSSPENFNALTAPLLDDMNAALEACGADPDVRAVVIRGEGRAFCAGGDVRAMGEGIAAGDARHLSRIVERAAEAARRIRGLRKPVLASVHGAAAGAGWSLALLCDFRVVSDDVRFVEAFAGLGLVPDMGGTLVLSRYLGLGRLTEFLMCGGTLSADEALALGLVNRVVSREDLDAETAAFAERLAALPVEAVARTKSLLNQTLFADLGLCLEREVEYQDALSRSDDYREAVAAFLAKRPPVFGRK